MSYFFDSAERTPHQPYAGTEVRSWWGEKSMIALQELEPGGVVAPHSHPNEELVMVIRGESEVTIGGETRVCKPGSGYIAPGGVTHALIAGPDGAAAVVVFTPIREEFKFA